MNFYTINALSKGEYESIQDPQGSWVSRTAHEAKVKDLQTALQDALEAIGYVGKCRHGNPTDTQCVDCALSDDSPASGGTEHG